MNAFESAAEAQAQNTIASQKADGAPSLNNMRF